MEWLSSKPVLCGWYWVRGGVAINDSLGEIVLVFGDGTVYRACSDWKHTTEDFEFFAGPISQFE
jgi:hypothetical protein